MFALPLAAGVLAPIGILLSPAMGALPMSLSTVIRWRLTAIARVAGRMFVERN